LQVTPPALLTLHLNLKNGSDLLIILPHSWAMTLQSQLQFSVVQGALTYDQLQK
jgi:hypothetical protein